MPKSQEKNVGKNIKRLKKKYPSDSKEQILAISLSEARAAGNDKVKPVTTKKKPKKKGK